MSLYMDFSFSISIKSAIIIHHFNEMLKHNYILNMFIEKIHNILLHWKGCYSNLHIEDLLIMQFIWLSNQLPKLPTWQWYASGRWRVCTKFFVISVPCWQNDAFQDGDTQGVVLFTLTKRRFFKNYYGSFFKNIIVKWQKS